MKSFGSPWPELSQFMSNKGFKEQPELIPMPNGYGTVVSPHLVAQSGFAVLLASEKDFPGLGGGSGGGLGRG